MQFDPKRMTMQARAFVASRNIRQAVGGFEGKNLENSHDASLHLCSKWRPDLTSPPPMRSSRTMNFAQPIFASKPLNHTGSVAARLMSVLITTTTTTTGCRYSWCVE
jgi:hypothetical protein